MPHNETLEREIIDAFERLPQKIDSINFKQDFIQKIKKSLDTLHNGYANDDIFEKCCGEYLLQEAINDLRRQSHISYINFIGVQGLLDCVNSAVSNAFDKLDLSNCLPEQFVSQYPKSWLKIFFEMIASPKWDLNIVFDKIIIIISLDFAKNVKSVDVSQDIYNFFHMHITNEMISIKESILVESDIDLMINVIKNRTPLDYKDKPRREFILVNESHPVNMLMSIQQIFYQEILKRISPAIVHEILSNHMYELNSFFHNIDLNSNEHLQARYIFIGTAAIALKDDCFEIAKDLLESSPERRNFQQFIGLVENYNNEFVLRMGSHGVYHAVISLIKQFLRIPQESYNSALTLVTNDNVPSLRLG